MIAAGAGFAFLMALLAGQSFTLPPGKTYVNRALMRFVHMEASNFLIVQPPVHGVVDAQSG